MKSNDENTEVILDKRLKEVAIKDMLEQEYEPMIELNRLLEMIIEDGDWEQETEKEIIGRIDVLWKTWYLLAITEKQVKDKSDLNEKYALLFKIGIYHQQNESLTDINIPVGTYPSEKEMKYIKEWAKEELAKE